MALEINPKEAKPGPMDCTFHFQPSVFSVSSVFVLGHLKRAGKTKTTAKTTFVSSSTWSRIIRTKHNFPQHD